MISNRYETWIFKLQCLFFFYAIIYRYQVPNSRNQVTNKAHFKLKYTTPCFVSFLCIHIYVYVMAFIVKKLNDIISCSSRKAKTKIVCTIIRTFLFLFYVNSATRVHRKKKFMCDFYVDINKFNFFHILFFTLFFLLLLLHYSICILENEGDS